MGELKKYLVRLLFLVIRSSRGYGHISPRDMKLHPKGEFISDDIRRTMSHYEIGLLTKVARLSRPGSFIDVGANIGNHSNFFQQLGLKGIAFEPSARNFQLLTVNAPNFRCMNFALGREPGSAIFLEYSNSSGNGHVESAMELSETHDSKFEVSIQRLDDVDCGWLTGPILMKVDVEGSELDVLMGGRSFLSSHHPILWLEVHKAETLTSANFRYTREDIFSEIRELGYDSFSELNPTNYLFLDSKVGLPNNKLRRVLLPL